jgi:selenide,water dikinase
MAEYGVRCATDITGFGLAGHALKMAEGSGVSIELSAAKVPAFDEVMDLIEMGVIPGATFRNKEFAEEFCEFDEGIDYNHKMLLFDAQTSGGLLMCAPGDKAAEMVEKLKLAGYPATSIVGEVKKKGDKEVYIA